MTEQETKQQPFPLEKILTVSAREYVDCVGTIGNLYGYRMVGVHGSDEQVFRRNVPTDAEVVVEYRVSKGTYSNHFGTALILKNKKIKNG